MQRHIVSLLTVLLLLGGLVHPSHGKTFVFPHLIETAGTVETTANSWDSTLEVFYASGVGPVPTGGGATVDIYLYDNSGVLLQSALSTDVCNPCTFMLGSRNLKEEIVIDDLILNAGSGSYPLALTSGWAIIDISGDPDAVGIDAFTSNNTGSPAEIELEQWQLPEMLRGTGASAPTSWVIPHAIDVEGSILDTQNAWDTFVYFTFAAGRGGVPAGTSVSVDVYLYEQDTEDLVKNDLDDPICAPCTFDLDPMTPKVSVDLEQLIRDGNGGNYTALSIHKMSLLMLVSGDADALSIGAATLNVRSSPADLRVVPLGAQAIVPPSATHVADGFPLRASLDAFPNPSLGKTTILFDAPRSGVGTLEVFDVRGRRIVTLVSGQISAGPQSVIWDGRDARGVPVGAGIYLARLQRGPWYRQAKVVVTR